MFVIANIVYKFQMSFFFKDISPTKIDVSTTIGLFASDKFIADILLNTIDSISIIM